MTESSYLPRFCVWELTLACNLRCGHCGSSAGRPRTDELDTEECLETVAELADLGCRQITLSGGEPTLRPDWDRIARAAVARGIAVNMVTNGTTMTDAMAARVAGSGLCNVGVSLDGSESVHDRVRGPGNYRRAVSALERLARVGIPTAVLTHLNRTTAPELEAICATAAELGARCFRVQLGKPMGRLAAFREETIRPRDLLGIIPRLVELRRSAPIEVALGDSIGYFAPGEELLRSPGNGGRGPWSGCQAGRLAIGIESDGGVKGCLSLQARAADGSDPFREGDLRSARLEQIWRASGAFAWNRTQRVEELTGACRRCEHARVCRGGAKCVAAAFTGSLTEDPYCYHAVASAERRSVGERLRRRAIASVLSVGLGALGTLAGCDHRAAPSPTDAGARDGISRSIDARGADLKPEGPISPCVCPDYGVGIPCTCDPCANVCCDCDYGVSPPPGCCD
jgi:radical SAM protein with 4Fe4S-binding SPASM domain